MFKKEVEKQTEKSFSKKILKPFKIFDEIILELIEDAILLFGIYPRNHHIEEKKKVKLTSFKNYKRIFLFSVKIILKKKENLFSVFRKYGQKKK